MNKRGRISKYFSRRGKAEDDDAPDSTGPQQASGEDDAPRVVTLKPSPLVPLDEALDVMPAPFAGRCPGGAR